MAIANNPDLAAGSYDPAISAERVSQARAAFLPTIQSGIQRNVQQAPPSSIFFGQQGVRTDVWAGNVASRSGCRGAAASYSVGWNSNRDEREQLAVEFNPSVTASLQGVFSQPLLRDFKIDPFRAEVDDVAAQPRDCRHRPPGARRRRRRRTPSAPTGTWCSRARAVAVQQRSLDLSLELERNNRARVDVGQSPPLDLVSASAEVAQRRENLIIAQTLVRQAEDKLRLLIIDPKRPDFWSSASIPSTSSRRSARSRTSTRPSGGRWTSARTSRGRASRFRTTTRPSRSRRAGAAGCAAAGVTI